MARHATKNRTWRKLSRRDLSTFDDYGVKAVLHAMDHGGVGKISSRGHVMIKAPDGRIMGVAQDTRKARQVIAISLRDLFGDDSLVTGDEKQKQTEPTPADPVVTPSGVHPCWEPSCTEVFPTEGAVYSHAHKAHHVCPHPGCHHTRNHRGHLLAHARTAHAAPGEHPRTKGAAKRASQEVPEPVAEAPETNPTAVEPPHDERAREHAKPSSPSLPYPIGTVARVMLGDNGPYIAELRRDFGKPIWQGSWHGFGINAERETVTVVEILEPTWRPADQEEEPEPADDLEARVARLEGLLQAVLDALRGE